MQSYKSSPMLNMVCNHDGAGDTFQETQERNSSPETLDNKQSGTASLPRRRGSSVLRNERRRKKLALQQVISVRQQKIYEQQCEIDELRRRVREVCNDNKFLREQNYWQAKALEKLDGKHAELPQLINGHLEEVRVFREQIRRIKEVLKLEKQRRHDAEGAKDKALFELKHLRKLADDHKLLEKEELMQTIAKLESENEEKARHLTNLERYAENLEKNQRFESQRYAKAQKEMRETCQNLLDRIHTLEQTVQEKQKIIELGNIYSKRAPKSQAMVNQTPETAIGTQESTAIQSEMASNADGDPSRTGFRNRMKEFDQRRQDMERRRDKVRKKRMALAELGRTSENEINDPTGDGDDISDGQRDRQLQMALGNPGSHSPENRQTGKTRGNHSPVVLPKIHSNDSSSFSRDSSLKRNRCAHETKQVRFSAPLQITEELTDSELIFHELQNNERVSRLVAEANLERELATINKGLAETKATATMDSSHSELMMRLKVIDRLNKPPMPAVQCKIKSQDRCSSRPTSSSTETGNQIQITSPLKSPSDQNLPCVDEIVTGIANVAPETATSGVQTSDLQSNSAASQIQSNSPRPPRTTSELSTLDSFEIFQPGNLSKQPCRPCGDHDIDDFLSEETTGGSPSGSDAMAVGGEEEFLWQETPSVMTGSPMSTTRMTPGMYRGPAGLMGNNSNEVDGLDIDYITQATFGFTTNKPVNPTQEITQKNSLPILNCSVGTKTLYTLCNQRKEGTD